MGQSTREPRFVKEGERKALMASVPSISLFLMNRNTPLAVKGRGTVTDNTDKHANAAWIVKAMCTVIDNTYKTCKCWMVFFYQNLLYHNFLIVEARFCSVCKPLLALISIKLYASTIKQA